MRTTPKTKPKRDEQLKAQQEFEAGGQMEDSEEDEVKYEGSISDAMSPREDIAEQEQESRNAERAQQLNVLQKAPKERMPRRGGIQTDWLSVFHGLMEKYNAMERIDAVSSGSKPVEVSDIDFIRILSPTQFRHFLQLHGVQTERFRTSSNRHAKSLKDLWTEVVLRQCTLEQYANEEAPDGLGLQRKVAAVFMELEAACQDGELRYLLLKDEIHSQSESRRNLNTRPSRKMFEDEDVISAIWRCMVQNLNLSEQLCKELFAVESVELRTEVKESSGFPGLRTIYNMHVVKMSVVDPRVTEVAQLGLPAGEVFQTELDNSLFAATTRCWIWANRHDFELAKHERSGEVIQSRKNSASDKDQNQMTVFPSLASLREFTDRGPGSLLNNEELPIHDEDSDADSIGSHRGRCRKCKCSENASVSIWCRAR